MTKAYRVKDVFSGKYLHVGDYEAHPGGVNGGVKVEAKEESGDQIFTIESAGNGQYYLNYMPEVGSLTVVHIPEPASATLSLLARIALAARRRRK